MEKLNKFLAKQPVKILCNENWIGLLEGTFGLNKKVTLTMETKRKYTNDTIGKFATEFDGGKDDDR